MMEIRFSEIVVIRLRGCASQLAGTAALQRGERIYGPIVLLFDGDGGGKGHRPTKVGKAMKNM